MDKNRMTGTIALCTIFILLQASIVYSIQMSGWKVDVGKTTLNISWNTDIASDTKLLYGVNPNYLDQQYYNSIPTTTHNIFITGLTPDTLYYLNGSSTSGTETVTSGIVQVTTLEATPPPKVTGLKAVDIGENYVKLSWDKTPATDLKYYQIFRDNIFISTSSSNLFEDKGLSADISYSYQVLAVDIRDNIGEKSDPIIVKTKPMDLTPPKISNISVKDVTDTAARIVFTTDEDSNATIYYADNPTPSNPVVDYQVAKTHSIAITNLEKLKKYFFKVYACDAKGNCASSELNSFVTGVSNEPPILDVTLPERWNKGYINIYGNTSPFADVKVYVDGQLTKTKSTGSSGQFVIEDVRLDTGKTQNIIKVKAITVAGKETEREFLINVDVKAPEVKLDEIANVSSTGSVKIKGVVSEASTLDILLKDESFGIPDKVTGLTATTTSQGVVLKWTLVKNATQYAVFREDIGLIGISREATFTDNALSSNTAYKYQVAGLNDYCEIGQKSDFAEAIVLQGTEREAVKLDLSECKPKAVKSVKVNGVFEETINLKEGYNDIKLIFTDDAGNQYTYSTTIYSRTKPPKMTVNLANLTVSYTPYVTIKGNVDEPATVVVFVNNHTKSDFELRTSLRTIIESMGKIGSGGDYIVETDQNGDFEVDIELEQTIELKEKKYDTSTGMPGIMNSMESGNKWRNEIQVVAIGKAGNKVSTKGIIDYMICGSGGDWNIVFTEFYPKTIKPRYWIEGFASVSFGMELTYSPGSWVDPRNPSRTYSFPPGTTVAVTKLSPMSAEMTADYDEEYIGSPNIVPAVYQDKIYYFVQVPLMPIKKPASFNGSEYDWEEEVSKNHKDKCFFGNKVVGCVRLPLMVSVTYSSLVPVWTSTGTTTGGGYQYTTQRVTQKMCFDVEVALDRQVIDPDRIPKKFLRNSVEFLNDTLRVIDLVLKPLKTITEYTTYACMVGFLGEVAMRVKEGMSCVGIKKSEMIGRCDGEPNNPCNDDDMNSCFDAMVASKKYRMNVKWLCSRVMCPAVPTYEKYIELMKAKNERDKQSSSNCVDAVPNYNTGSYEEWKSQKDEKMKEYKENYFLPPYTTPSKEFCPYEYMYAWDSGCIAMDEYAESHCVNLDKDSDAFNNWECGGFEQAWRSISDFKVCKVGEQPEYTLIKTGGNIRDGFQNQQYFIIDNKNRKVYPAEYVEVAEGNKLRDDKGKIVTDNTKPDYNTVVSGTYSGIKVSSANNMQMWYVPNNEKEILSWEKNGKSCDDEIAKNGMPKVSDNNNPCLTFENTGKCFACVNQNNAAYKDKQKEMKESCTYILNGKNVQIPPAVYNSICTFQGSRQYVVDPTSGLMRSVQCVCLTSTKAYLEHYRAIINSLKKCFESILYTGSGSAGTCRALISVHICDLIYDALNCVSQKSGKGYGAEYEGDISGWFSAISKGMAMASESIREDYGGTNMFRALFIDQKLVQAACVGAFTGDWDAAITGAVSAAMEQQNINSTVLVPVADREFLSYNPISGVVNHMYHIGFYFAAGAQITNLQVSLVCSQDNSCPEFGGPCDCVNKVANVIPELPINGYLGISTGVPKNTIIDKEGFIPVPKMASGMTDKSYAIRYDKVKVHYEYLDNTGKIVKNDEYFKISQIGLQYPPECKFNYGYFSCSVITDPRGSAYFEQGSPIIRIFDNNKQIAETSIGQQMLEVYLGEKIEIKPNIKVVPPPQTGTPTSYMLYVSAKSQGKNVPFFNGKSDDIKLISYNAVNPEEPINPSMMYTLTQDAFEYSTSCSWAEDSSRNNFVINHKMNPNTCIYLNYNKDNNKLEIKTGFIANNNQCSIDTNTMECQFQNQNFLCRTTSGDLTVTVTAQNSAEGTYMCKGSTSSMQVDLEFKLLYPQATSGVTPDYENVIYFNDGPQVRTLSLIINPNPRAQNK